MQPLSARARRRYFIFFILCAVISIPVAIFYASGYRFDGSFSLVKTGGIYIAVPLSGTTISLNGDEVGTSSFFNRGFYIDNLAPGSYVIYAIAPEVYPWHKTLIVEPKVVTDARAFLVPEKLVAVELITATSTLPVSTTTLPIRTITALERANLLSVFVLATTTPQTILSVDTTTYDDTRGGFGLKASGGTLFVVWTRATSTLPSSFCIRPSSCTHTITIEEGADEIMHARFFNDGVLYQTKTNGIFFAEIDRRPTTLTVPVYPRRGAEFRIVDGKIIIKDGTDLYEISGW